MTSYRLAPEWARQDAVILVWPHQYSDWADSENSVQLNTIEKTYSEIVRYISRNQKVVLIAYDHEQVPLIENYLSNNGCNLKNLIFIAVPSNDTWVRDYGPVFVHTDSEKVLLDFKFDAWGKKYTHQNDNDFNQTLRSELFPNLLISKIDTVLEAGNIEVNDSGCLLSSKSCFERDYEADTARITSIETLFRVKFGCDQIFWIDNVKLAGDDTDGHIDNLARFCPDDIIVYSAIGHPTDPNNNSLDTLKLQLDKIKRDHKNDLELIPIPLPKPISKQNEQLPASYVNFLITNDYVLVPVFGDKQENSTLKIIDECFPSKEIIDIDSNALIQQLGGVHCAAMHIPQGFLS